MACPHSKSLPEQMHCRLMGLHEAADRASRYRDAGADLVFIDGVKTVEQVEAIARRVDAPKVVSLVDGTPASILTAPQLQQMGFQVVLYAVTTLFAAAAAARLALEALRDGGQVSEQPAMSYEAFCELVDLPKHEQFDAQAGAAPATTRLPAGR